MLSPIPEGPRRVTALPMSCSAVLEKGNSVPMEIGELAPGSSSFHREAARMGARGGSGA